MTDLEHNNAVRLLKFFVDGNDIRRSGRSILFYEGGRQPPEPGDYDVAVCARLTKAVGNALVCMKDCLRIYLVPLWGMAILGAVFVRHVCFASIYDFQAAGMYLGEVLVDNEL